MRNLKRLMEKQELPETPKSELPYEGRELSKSGIPKGGRPKGSADKTALTIKKAFANMLEVNSENIMGWLDRVAEKDPAKALEIVGRFASFFIPRKLSGEIEITGNPINIVLPKRDKTGFIEVQDVEEVKDIKDENL